MTFMPSPAWRVGGRGPPGSSRVVVRAARPGPARHGEPAQRRLLGKQRPRPDCMGGAGTTRAPDRRCSLVVAPARASPAATVCAVAVARSGGGHGTRDHYPTAAPTNESGGVSMPPSPWVAMGPPRGDLLGPLESTHLAVSITDAV